MAVAADEDAVKFAAVGVVADGHTLVGGQSNYYETEHTTAHVVVAVAAAATAVVASISVVAVLAGLRPGAGSPIETPVDRLRRRRYG